MAADILSALPANEKQGMTLLIFSYSQSIDYIRKDSYMYGLLEDLMINVSMVITLIFLFMKARWGNRQEISSAWLIDGVAGGLMGMILMHFSIDVAQGTIADFRYIPIVLLILFVGRKSALISTIIIALGRFLISVSLSSYIALAVSVFLFIGLLVIDQWKMDAKLMDKAFMMIAYSAFLYTAVLINRVTDTTVLYPLVALYWIISVAGGLLAVFFMNYVRTTEYLLRKYEIESTVDFLTGLKNARKFDQMFNRYKNQALASGDVLTVAMIDIDNFKQFNDTYGHAAGDFVLMEMAQIFERILGKEAYVFRKGGEEFVVLFPSVPFGRVITLMESCRKQVEQHPFEINDYTKVCSTISVGISQYPSTVPDISQLADAADRKLYRAKDSGRNVVIY